MLNYESKDFHLSLFQNYGSLTHVTRLKVAVNMADSTSLFRGQFVPLKFINMQFDVVTNSRFILCWPHKPMLVNVLNDIIFTFDIL